MYAIRSYYDFAHLGEGEAQPAEEGGGGGEGCRQAVAAGRRRAEQCLQRLRQLFGAAAGSAGHPGQRRLAALQLEDGDPEVVPVDVDS